MDFAQFAPLIERLGSFALIVWLMVTYTLKTNQKLDEVAGHLQRSAELLERATQIMDRMEKRFQERESNV